MKIIGIVKTPTLSGIEKKFFKKFVDINNFTIVEGLSPQIVRVEDWKDSHSLYPGEVAKFIRQQILAILEGLEIKHDRAGYGGGSQYDSGYNDGYNQCVDELKKRILEVKK